MSDNTAKEQPKTCGTCGWFAPEPYKRVSGACMGSYKGMYHATSARNSDVTCPWCPGWRPKESDCESCPERLPQDACKVKAHCYDLEKRNEQLERVAKEMLGCVFGHRYWTFREQLEALGVDVDG